MRDYTLSYPALMGGTVTEGHARFCRENGHSTHTEEGVRDILCPRCGDEAWKFCTSCKGPIEHEGPAVCEYCEPTSGATSTPLAMSDTPDETGHAYYVPTDPSVEQWQPRDNSAPVELTEWELDLLAGRES